MSTRILAALLFSPLLFSCGDEGTISYKEKMPPAVPGNLEAVAGSQQITLTWDKVGNASSYRIYWDTKEIEATRWTRVALASLDLRQSNPTSRVIVTKNMNL